MPDVVVTRRYPDGATQPLFDARLEVDQWTDSEPMSRELLLSKVSSARGMLASITERVDEALLAAAPQLKVVAEYGVGYDNIDVEACTRRGVLVCNTPGVLAETTADLTWSLILGAARHLREGIEFVQQGRWQAWDPFAVLGHDVHHRTLGVLGLGAIGWEVARRAAGFDMRVLYVSTRPHPEREALLPGLERVELDDLLRSSDFVSIHVALSAATRHLISSRELALMKPSAYLINVARGAVVDQQALYDACRDRRIAGAALDVTDPEPMLPDHPLLALPNVTVIPHVGSATVATRIRMGQLASQNIVAVLTGQRPPTAVNSVP